MAALTIQVPNPLVAELATLAQADLVRRGVDTTGWTQTQIGQRWIAALIGDQLINSRRSAAEATMQASLQADRTAQQATVDTAVTAATATAATITG